MFPILACICRSLFLLFVFKLETPIYYLMKNQKEKALEFIHNIYKEEYCTEILDE
jgi:hypothetical protein